MVSLPWSGEKLLLLEVGERIDQDTGETSGTDDDALF